MNDRKVQKAKAEAERLIERCDAVLRKAQDDRYIFYGSKESAAFKRASMDLTRTLAELRRPG